MGFNECIAPTVDAEALKWENVPGDRGGGTFGGLDSKDDAAWPGWPLVFSDIAAGKDPAKNPSTITALKSWYFNKYWLPAQLDYFPEAIQQAAFGCVVNQGLEGFTKIMQKALNRTGASLTVDGVLGQATIAAVNKAPLLWLEDAFSLWRLWAYLDDADADPATQDQFLRGWDNRVRNGE
jgi:lysozyme family protein